MTERTWIYNGVEFQKGDRVRVVGLTEGKEEDSMGLEIKWDNIWVPQMDKALGHFFEINSIDERGAFFCEIEGQVNEEGFGYPLSVLQKATFH